MLSNLVTNAIDAMRGGGTLVVRTRRATEYRDLRDGVAITVADTGDGMESAVGKQVFDAFFTSKKEHGTGLGLWITKGIVEKHRGHLSTRSRLHRGTVFRLFIPTNAVE